MTKNTIFQWFWDEHHAEFAAGEGPEDFVLLAPGRRVVERDAHVGGVGGGGLHR